MSDQYEFKIAERDEAFIEGMSDDYMAYDSVTPKVVKGEAYVLHISSNHIIAIINPGYRWFMSHLYVLHVSEIGGGNGVYADNESEAYDLLADYCAEGVPDPDDETGTGDALMRWPGLISTWQQALDDSDGDEQVMEDSHTGPYGNEGLYFRSHTVSAEVVDGHHIPPIPDSLFPCHYEIEFAEFLSWIDSDPGREPKHCYGPRMLIRERAAWELRERAERYDVDYAAQLGDWVVAHDREFHYAIGLLNPTTNEHDGWIHVLVTRKGAD